MSTRTSPPASRTLKRPQRPTPRWYRRQPERELADKLDAEWKAFIAAGNDVQALANKGDVSGSQRDQRQEGRPDRPRHGRHIGQARRAERQGRRSGRQQRERNLCQRDLDDGYHSRRLGRARSQRCHVSGARHLRRHRLDPEAMGQLTDGQLEAVIPHQGESTEIGRIASALQIFKDALIAKRAADQAAGAEAAIKAARAETITKATSNFESMISELVGSLSSASTELEASATTLTRTSDITMTLSGSAASASHTVSSNVQSVAAATEEITSSVNEIGRQVHESEPYRFDRRAAGREDQ